MDAPERPITYRIAAGTCYKLFLGQIKSQIKSLIKSFPKWSNTSGTQITPKGVIFESRKMISLVNKIDKGLSYPWNILILKSSKIRNTLFLVINDQI
jgi:hypothetical protein